MLEKLVNSFQPNLCKEGAFDASKFNDPIATQIEWTPANKTNRGNNRGGATFCSERLTEINSERIEFKTTLFTKVFCSFFILMGIVGVMIILSTTISFNEINKHTNIHNSGNIQYENTIGMPEVKVKGGPMSVVMGLIVCVAFIYAGMKGLYLYSSAIVFDKEKGFFWKGRKIPNDMLDNSDSEDFVRLNEIYALQLISKYYINWASDICSHNYELNLVLENGKRINVADHGDKNQLYQDANTLSQFLGKPLWNGI